MKGFNRASGAGRTAMGQLLRLGGVSTWEGMRNGGEKPGGILVPILTIVILKKNTG